MYGPLGSLPASDNAASGTDIGVFRHACCISRVTKQYSVTEFIFIFGVCSRLSSMSPLTYQSRVETFAAMTAYYPHNNHTTNIHIHMII